MEGGRKGQGAFHFIMEEDEGREDSQHLADFSL